MSIINFIYALRFFSLVVKVLVLCHIIWYHFISKHFSGLHIWVTHIISWMSWTRYHASIDIVTCQVHPALVKRVQCTLRSFSIFGSLFKSWAILVLYWDKSFHSAASNRKKNDCSSQQAVCSVFTYTDIVRVISKVTILMGSRLIRYYSSCIIKKVAITKMVDTSVLTI